MKDITWSIVYSRAAAAALAVVLAACGLAKTAPQAADPYSSNLLFAHMPLPVNRYPIADDAVVHAHYRLAFKAYYQLFFCPQPNSTSIPPDAYNFGAAKPFREALLLAYSARYAEASTVMKQATAVDPRFGEAFYLAGVIALVRKQRPAACNFWAAAVRNPGYPATQSVGTVRVYQQSSKTMRLAFCHKVAPLRAAATPGLSHQHFSG